MAPRIDWISLTKVILQAVLAIFAAYQGGGSQPAVAALSMAALTSAIHTSVSTGNAPGLMKLIPTETTLATLPPS